MSDEVKRSSNLPIDPEMPGSGISLSPMFYASKADQTIIRMAKLIKTTAGLNSLMSVSAYTCYILAYLHTASPTRAELIAKISQAIGRPTKIPVNAVKGPNPYIPIIAIINDTRFAIRLTGLINFYVLLRGLIKNRSPKDQVLHNLALLQTVSYIIFQVLENVWLLTTKAVIAPRWVERAGGSMELLKWSCRAWWLALTCDFGRLAREAMIEKEQQGEKVMTQEERKKVHQKWYSDLFTVCAWYPMALHYSLPGGIGLNQGLVGLSGACAGIGGLSRAWAATKE